jgi:hypothetical protein
MDDEPVSDEPVPEKKSFMDDDDDVPAAPAAPREKTKAEKDREADEAFRKAAEADGMCFPFAPNLNDMCLLITTSCPRERSRTQEERMGTQWLVQWRREERTSGCSFTAKQAYPCQTWRSVIFRLRS